MGDDELRKEILNLSSTQRISDKVARHALANPVEGAKIVSQLKLEDEVARQGVLLDDANRALFGDKKQKLPGLVVDVSDLKEGQRKIDETLSRGIWTLVAWGSLGGTALALLGLWIEYNKH